MTEPQKLFTGNHLAPLDLAAVRAQNKRRSMACGAAAVALGGMTMDEFRSQFPDADLAELMKDQSFVAEVELLSADPARQDRCITANNRRALIELQDVLRKKAAEPEVSASSAVSISDTLLKIDGALLRRAESTRDGVGARSRKFMAMDHVIMIWGPEGLAQIDPKAGTIEEVTAAVVRALGSVDDEEVQAVRQAIENGRGEGQYPAWP